MVEGTEMLILFNLQQFILGLKIVQEPVLRCEKVILSIDRQIKVMLATKPLMIMRAIKGANTREKMLAFIYEEIKNN
jgi:hypothetical protein